MTQVNKSWLRRRIEQGLVRGLTHAYETVKVNPEKFLIQLRAAYSLPITSFQGVYALEPARIDEIAESVLRSSTSPRSGQRA